MESNIFVKASRFFLIVYLFRMKCLSSAITCSALGQLENGKTFFRYGGIFAHFSCNPGFSLLGHMSSSCVGGRWRKSIPLCVASGCHMPSGIAHGSLQVSHNYAVIIFTCKKGYKLIGSSMIYCDGKKWNGTIPMCREMDMMDSSLPKKNSEAESTFVIENSLLKKEPKWVSFNVTETGHDNTEKARKEKDFKNLLKAFEHQRQLLPPKTFLSFSHEKNRNQSTFNASKTVKNISTPENHTEQPNIKKLVTSWPSTATQMQYSKITQKNQTSQIKAFLNVTESHDSTTPRSLRSRAPQEKYLQFVEHGKNVVKGPSGGPLRTTTSDVPQATQRIESQYLSTLLENSTPENTRANISPHRLLAVTHEEISKTIPRSSQPYNTGQIMTNTTNLSEHTYIKVNTTPATMLTGIMSSPMNYNHISDVQVQTQQTIVEATNVEAVSTTDQNVIMGRKVTPIDQGYKTTVIPSTSLSKVKIYSAQKPSPDPPKTTSAVIAIILDSMRNQKNFGIMQKPYKRRVQCVYPPVPSHGTFRFFTIRDPLPYQYPYYIHYSCYPGYTMSIGDVHSFCKDNGEWSGITPVCEGE